MSVILAAFLALLAAPLGPLGCGGGATGSIGAVLGKRGDGRLYVREVPPGMSAWTAGLEPDDEIVAIDGREVRAMTPEDVSKALRGTVGSDVTLTVKRGGLARDVKVRRGPFRQGGPT
jgi:carboxyl-terminal processing protease